MLKLNKHDNVTAPAGQPGLLAPDTSGMNFYRADPALTDLLRIHLPDALFRHIEPHLDRLGGLAGLDFPRPGPGPEVSPPHPSARCAVPPYRAASRPAGRARRRSSR